ncbi:hypothetical protein, variant 3 [Exophiala mesophila]|uniref:Velvet domain-containing protein n=1 Tax=Exophiala mesophila TaxID=212818 RepID=A0A0D1WUT6_EXOME|nr:hypothetical protein, variant 3 [Exophiala mesophila]KIV93005.1 hypothetical protein, variant 3 [Exophiala mesophila]
MELAIGPPSRMTAGLPLQHPLVVTFSSANKDKEGNAEALRLQDLTGVWAFVSLTNPDMEQNLAPPRIDLLRGQTADSIHPIQQRQEGDDTPVAYATFAGLIITEPGKYRLRINLIDMNAPLLEDQGSGAGKVLRVLHSPTVDVVEDGQRQHVFDEAELNNAKSRLRSIGVDC